jgi:hypothetical protein
MSCADDVIDLIIDRLISDQSFPRMSRMAWLVKLSSLQQPISDRFDEHAKERVEDAIREITD